VASFKPTYTIAIGLDITVLHVLQNLCSVQVVTRNQRISAGWTGPPLSRDV